MQHEAETVLSHDRGFTELYQHAVAPSAVPVNYVQPSDLCILALARHLLAHNLARPVQINGVPLDAELARKISEYERSEYRARILREQEREKRSRSEPPLVCVMCDRPYTTPHFYRQWRKNGSLMKWWCTGASYPMQDRAAPRKEEHETRGERAKRIMQKRAKTARRRKAKQQRLTADGALEFTPQRADLYFSKLPAIRIVFNGKKEKDENLNSSFIKPSNSNDHHTSSDSEEEERGSFSEGSSCGALSDVAYGSSDFASDEEGDDEVAYDDSGPSEESELNELGES